MKQTNRLEGTRFQVKSVNELDPIMMNVKYAQTRMMDSVKITEIEPPRMNVKYAQVNGI